MEQVTDRWGNRITLTNERWQHIIEWHPELEGFQEEVLETIQKGRRRQDPIDQQKYKYIGSSPYRVGKKTGLIAGKWLWATGCGVFR